MKLFQPQKIIEGSIFALRSWSNLYHAIMIGGDERRKGHKCQLHAIKMGGHFVLGSFALILSRITYGGSIDFSVLITNH